MNIYHVAHCPNGCQVGGDWSHYEPCQDCGADLTLVQITDEHIDPIPRRSDTTIWDVAGGILLAAAALFALASFLVGAGYILRGLW